MPQLRLFQANADSQLQGGEESLVQYVEDYCDPSTQVGGLFFHRITLFKLKILSRPEIFCRPQRQYNTS